MKINPYKQDLFKKLIEHRTTLKEKRDTFEKETKDYNYYERMQKIVKIITNSISYGIFVEVNTDEATEKIPISVYGLKKFTVEKTKIEKPGPLFNPIIAVAITSAARLLLASSEVLLLEKGESHAYCDTDSMIVPHKYTKYLQDFFQPLNPYSFEGDVFECEKEDLWFYGISSKRYCLYTRNGNEINIKSSRAKKDYSAHGLGHLLNPLKMNDSKDEDEEHWHKEIWKDIIKLELGIISMEELQEKYEGKYALQKLAISKPRILDRLKQFNGEGTDYHNQIKPFNFAMLGFSNLQNEKGSETVKPLAPYNKVPRHAVSDYFIDNNEKKKIKKLRGVQYWKQFWDLFGRYLENRESKLEGDRGILERKHMFLEKIVHIGKESDNLDYVDVFGADEYSVELYEDRNELNKEFLKNKEKISKLSAKYVEDITGIPRSTLWRVKINLENGNYDKTSDRIKIALISCLKKYSNTV